MNNAVSHLQAKEIFTPGPALPVAFQEGMVSLGASSAPTQTEGHAEKSDWYAWLTPETAQILARQASNKDWGQGRISNLPPEAFDPNNYIPGIAVDHWNRYEEDFSLGKEIGLQSYHSGLEWSRIEPKHGQPYDKLAIEHYRKILKSARANGMELIMDLSHFSLPLWARDMGGWESGTVVEAFASFAEDMASEFQDEVTYWATFNEPDTYTTMVHMPWPIPRDNAWLDYPRGWDHFRRARKNMVLANQLAYQAIKASTPEAQVGFTVSMAHYDGRRDPLSAVMRTAMKAKTNEYFAPRMAPDADWIGLQYYMHARVKFPQPFANEFKQRSDQGWELYPEGHYHLLKWLSKEVASKHGIPILITESGVADRDDTRRSDYLQESIRWMDEAIAEGVDCRAFCVWSLTDNFEWDRGRRPRYGLIAIDYDNKLKRSIRPGALDYGELIRQRQTVPELLRDYSVHASQSE